MPRINCIIKSLLTKIHPIVVAPPVTTTSSTTTSTTTTAAPTTTTSTTTTAAPTTTTSTTTTAAPTTTTSTTTTTTAGPQNLTVSYNILAGGGAGSTGGNSYSPYNAPNWFGGGGGAGGYLTGSATKTTLTAYNISVGAGGNRSTNYSTPKGGNGTNSVFDTHTAIGGGGGGYGAGGGAESGGSGGGAGQSSQIGSGTPGQGFAGRQWPVPGYSQNGAGGGGGAGGSPPIEYPTPYGETATSGNCCWGGPGVYSSLLAYNVGGGGAGSQNSKRPPGGAGGGGYGGTSYSTPDNLGNERGRDGADGSTNTGGGGGGGGTSNSTDWRIANGGNGGSGAIALRIPDTFTATFSAGLIVSGGGAGGGFRTYTITGGSGTVTFN